MTDRHDSTKPAEDNCAPAESQPVAHGGYGMKHEHGRWVLVGAAAVGLAGVVVAGGMLAGLTSPSSGGLLVSPSAMSGASTAVLLVVVAALLALQLDHVSRRRQKPVDPR
jgi:hypothetical protein